MPLPGPLDLPASVGFLSRWGDDGLDRWDGAHLVRTVPMTGRSVAFAARSGGTREAPILLVRVERPGSAHAVEPAVAEAVASAVRASFLQPPPGFAALLRRDRVLRRLERRHPGVRPVLQLDLLGALVRAVSAQQVNLRWAATTRRRLAEAFGEPHEVAGLRVHSLAAERLAAATPAEIRALQFTTRKAEFIVGAAEAVASRRLSVELLRGLPDEEAIERLTAIRGVGPWTAEWILARTLGRPRVVAGDLGVRKAVSAAYLGGRLGDERDVRTATAHWGAHGAVAQAMLLHGLAEGSLPDVPGRPGRRLERALPVLQDRVSRAR